MLRWTRFETPRQRLAAAAILMTLTLAMIPLQTAFALITGGEGNSPIRDPGWPPGAAAIFNHPGRVAWWEGPPFGGGQWHAECRGDARALNGVLAEFARLDVKTKRVVIHDGVGRSFWLNPNREPAKQAAARIDWVFMVWRPASWERLRQLPGDLNPIDSREMDKGPPVQIDVYTGGHLRWSDVTVPDGLQITDERLEAHGFTQADGNVLEGRALDLASRQPVAARMRLQRIDTQSSGGYQYTAVAEAAADEQGRWVLKHAPAGWYRVVVEAGGYVPRVVGYARFDDQPSWHSYACGLSRPAPVSGCVTDEAGQGLADVKVQLMHVVASENGRYESPHDDASETDADGRFRLDHVPVGKASIWPHKPGYCRLGLGLPIITPAADISLSMMKAARVCVTVDFAGAARPAGYIVHMEPEGGEDVGKWSGSGNIDAKNQISFADVPPGRYVLRGQPNPSTANQQTEPLTIDLKGGQMAEVTLPAK